MYQCIIGIVGMLFANTKQIHFSREKFVDRNIKHAIMDFIYYCLLSNFILFYFETGSHVPLILVGESVLHKHQPHFQASTSSRIELSSIPTVGIWRAEVPEASQSSASPTVITSFDWSLLLLHWLLNILYQLWCCHCYNTPRRQLILQTFSQTMCALHNRREKKFAL